MAMISDRRGLSPETSGAVGASPIQEHCESCMRALPCKEHWSEKSLEFQRQLRDASRAAMRRQFSELKSPEASGVLTLAIRLARLADEHPRQLAVDALDIAAVLLRFGRDYVSGLDANPLDCSQSLSRAQESV